MVLEYLITILIGVAVGMFVDRLLVSATTMTGTMKINLEDPNKDVYSLELNGPVNEMLTMKQIVLDIEVIGDITQD